PVKVGAIMLVMLSMVDVPLSDTAARSGVPGAAGAVASIVTVRATEAALMLPARSVALAAITWAPSVNATVVTDQFPQASARALPMTVEPLNVAPLNSVIVAFAAAVPVNVGVV